MEACFKAKLPWPACRNEQRFRQALLTNCRPRITQTEKKSAKLVLRNNGIDVRAVERSENPGGINPRPFEGKCFCFYSYQNLVGNKWG